MKLLPAAGPWTADPTRTTASFEVANFIVNRVAGTITVRSGAVQTDARGRPTSVTAELESASISTGNPRRDKDLRSPHFLDVSHHPVMGFTSTSVSDEGDDGWTVAGLLTVGVMPAPLTLTVRLRPSSDPDTVQVVAQGSIDRADAGIKAPGFLIGRTVQVTIEAALSTVASHVSA